LTNKQQGNEDTYVLSVLFRPVCDKVYVVKR